MDPLNIVGYALHALELVPGLVKAGKDIAAYVSKTAAVIRAAQESKEPIPAAAWDELKAVREELQGRLHS
jgi:hypothetical protein